MQDPKDKPLVLAAPAPGTDAADLDELDALGAPLDEAELARLRDRDQLMQAYAQWCRTRGFFGQAPVSTSVLGKLQKRRSAVVGEPGGPDAPCSAEMSALHLAVTAQPEDALDRKVFKLHYIYNVRNVKEAAHTLGVSRAHWYRLLRAFCDRVVIGMARIQQVNLDKAGRLPHITGVREIPDESD